MKTFIMNICCGCQRPLKGANLEQALHALFEGRKVDYSHGLCEPCVERLYGKEVAERIKAKRA